MKIEGSAGFNPGEVTASAGGATTRDTGALPQAIAPRNSVSVSRVVRTIVRVGWWNVSGVGNLLQTLTE